MNAEPQHNTTEARIRELTAEIRSLVIKHITLRKNQPFDTYHIAIIDDLMEALSALNRVKSIIADNCNKETSV